MKKVVKDVLGVDLYYYMPDYETFSQQSLAVLNDMGFRTVLESFAYSDWRVYSPPDEKASLKLWKQNLHCGEIFLLHTLCDTNIRILPEFIEYARELGYDFALIQ